MDNISISVPNEPRAIAAAAEFFVRLREDAYAGVERDDAQVPACLCAPTAPCGINSTSIDPAGQASESVPEAAAVFAPTALGDGAESEIVIPAPPALPPTPAPALPPVPAPGVQLDSAGTPWDSRIHSSSKAFVADGTWRLRRNLDPNILAAVKAELGQAMSAPAPIIPAAPVVPPQPPVAPTAPVVLTFPGLLQKITAAGITKEQASAAAVKLGLPSFALVATRPDLLPAMAAELGVA